MPLWVYLRSSGQLQYIITNQRGGREGREEKRSRGGGGEVVRSILDGFPEKWTVKGWCKVMGMLKMPLRESARREKPRRMC